MSSLSFDESDCNTVLHYVNGKKIGKFTSVPVLPPPAAALNGSDAIVSFATSADDRIEGYCIHAELSPVADIAQGAARRLDPVFWRAPPGDKDGKVSIPRLPFEMNCIFAVQVVICCGVGEISQWSKPITTPENPELRAQKLKRELEKVSEEITSQKAWANGLADQLEYDQLVRDAGMKTVGIVSTIKKDYADILGQPDHIALNTMLIKVFSQASSILPMRSKSFLEKKLALVVKELSGPVPDPMNLDEMQMHENDAVYIVVTCPLCKDEVIKKDLDEHKTQWCRTTCSNCGLKVAHDTLTFHHVEECRHRLTRCGKCDKEMKYHELASHASHDCSHRPIQCEKCKATLSANEKSKHDSEPQTLMEEFKKQQGDREASQELLQSAGNFFNTRGYNFFFLRSGKIEHAGGQDGCRGFGSARVCGVDWYCRKMGFVFKVKTNQLTDLQFIGRGDNVTRSFVWLGHLRVDIL